jgi:hypothetical protein
MPQIGCVDSSNRCGRQAASGRRTTDAFYRIESDGSDDPESRLSGLASRAFFHAVFCPPRLGAISYL